MKNLSLQDQLLKAGLTNDTKAKQVRTEKRKQNKKQRKNKVEVVDEAKQLAQEAKANQQEKDRLLNQQRNQQAEKKQLANQIAQLIEANKCPQDEEGTAYNFTDQNKVKTIYINDEVRKKLIAGKLAIVKSSSSYEVIVIGAAEKVKQLDAQCVIVHFDNTMEESQDDEYQGYEVPDDLMW